MPNAGRENLGVRLRKIVASLGAVAGIAVAPLLGSWCVGRLPPELFALPPPIRVLPGSTGFSWLACAFVTMAIVAVSLGLLGAWRPASSGESVSQSTHRKHSRREGAFWRRIPSWGWLSLVWTLGWWIIAWTRLPSLSAVQRYTFFPLWLGFIFTANAVAVARWGDCLMLRSPGRWFGLFSVSGAFWWMFEWLNRFVENWHYVGVADLSATVYAVHATLSFSTVLPAVAAVSEIWSASPCLTRWALRGPRWPWLQRPKVGAALIGVGYGLLVATGIWPLLLYASLWSAPLLVVVGIAVVRNESEALDDLATGNWIQPLAWMLAGLVCGGFWELWNEYSLAKWYYTVPGVNRWHVFEMPLLGYSGYLPFGIECLLVMELAIGRGMTSRRGSPPSGGGAAIPSLSAMPRSD